MHLKLLVRHGLAWVILVAATAYCGVASGGESTTYPARPIRLLVPFAPGGGTDAVARIIATEMNKAIGQPWVVDNRGGAGGNLAAEFVARAAPDGYTVLHGVSTVLTVNPSLYENAQFNSVRDFEPVTLLGAALIMMVIHPGVQANTLKEFIALVRQKPGAFNYATAGVGSPPHLAAEVFNRRVGIKMVHVPFKGGNPAAIAAIAGDTQVMFGSVVASMPMVDAGKLRALATTGARRSKVAPDVPTVAESGFPGFDVSSWHALLLPARTPQTIVNQLRAAAIQVLDVPSVQKAMASQGLEIETSTPQELAARIRTESAMWAGIIKDLGLRAE